MRLKVIVGLILILSLHAFLNAPIVEAAPYTDITATTAYQAITSGICPNLVILDVRTRQEFDLYHIRNALLIPHDQIEERIDELTEHKNHEIIVYCLGGSRSAMACSILEAYGFNKIYNMIGGINAWKEQGYPTTSSYSTQIFFNINPNPAQIGQEVLVKGILLDQFANPVPNQNVKLYYRGLSGSSQWRLAIIINTKTNGTFLATGKLSWTGLYQLCAYYGGGKDYEASYQMQVLIALQ